MPWVVQMPLQSTVAWASTRDPGVSVVPNRLSWEFFSFEVLLFGLFVLLVTLFLPMTAKRWMASFLAPSPGEWVEYFCAQFMDGATLCDSGLMQVASPLPTLSWKGFSVPHALLDEQAPVWCALSHHCSWLTHLSSYPWLWHEFPLCFGHLRISFVVVCLIVGLVLFFVFFWAWSDNFKFYSFYFYVFEVGKGIFHVSSFSYMWGFCCLFKIIAHACVTESSLSMFVLVAI